LFLRVYLKQLAFALNEEVAAMRFRWPVVTGFDGGAAAAISPHDLALVKLVCIFSLLSAAYVYKIRL
jgi:hypothetical protein